MNRMHSSRGTTFFECVVALVILGAAMLTVARMTVAVMGQQRDANLRQLARQEAANVMERLFHSMDDRPTAITAGNQPEIELSDTARRWLPGAAIAASVERVNESPPGHRIQVEIRWTDRAGQPARPVRLVAWRYDTERTP
jgi:Tfp pilus assembly protein PilV